jgi:uncharacterized protein (TIGR03435 family)
MLRSVSLVVAAMASSLAFGQAFEVASVKLNSSSSGAIGMFTYPGGRIVASNETLRMLIHDAYELELYQILGGPDWMDDDRYDIEAKPPESSASNKWTPASFKSPPNPEMRMMLRTLLVDRFQLKVRPETRKESVFALAVAKGGPKLKEPTTTNQAFVKFGQGSILFGENATMAQLSERLTRILNRKVLDQTGLTGHFDFQLNYADDNPQPDTTSSVLRALQDQLGLKLETQPGSSDILVIEHAEKPSAN